jgi:hypothetical protein
MASLFLALVVSAAGCGDSNNNSADFSMPPADLLPPPEDAAPYVPACDPIAQTGCGTGEHCTVAKVNGAPMEACIPTPKNPIPEGGTCMPLQLQGSALVGDSCAPGTACIGLIDVFKCRPFCFQHSDCASGSCVAPTGSPLRKMFSKDVELALATCTANEGCDPVVQTGCPRCFVSRGDVDSTGNLVSRITFCGMSSGQLPAGGSCSSSADCAAGYRCSGLGFCRKLCYVTDGPDGGDPAAGLCPAPIVCAPIAATSDVYGECD